MKRPFRNANIGVGMTLALGALGVLAAGCGTIGVDGFLGLETCDIFNCDGLLFANLADDHDDMDGMNGENDDMDADQDMDDMDHDNGDQIGE